jgi:hypothetical protein
MWRYTTVCTITKMLYAIIPPFADKCILPFSDCIVQFVKNQSIMAVCPFLIIRSFPFNVCVHLYTSTTLLTLKLCVVNLKSGRMSLLLVF